MAELEVKDIAQAVIERMSEAKDPRFKQIMTSLVKHVHAFVQEPWLYVTIENPVDPDAPPSTGTGTGLVNIRNRLATLYGERARIGWTRHPNSFSLEMVLPTTVAEP